MSHQSQSGDLKNETSRCRRWFVAQEGAREHYSIPVAFERIGRLDRLFTDVWCDRGRNLLRRGPAGARALAGRFHESIPGDKVWSSGGRAVAWKAWRHLIDGRSGPEERARFWVEYGRWFGRGLVQYLERCQLDPATHAFFGFNTNSLEAVEFLRSAGVFTVVDQIDPGKVEEEMIQEEATRWPGWEKLPGRLPQFYWDRLHAEWDAADMIVVNSNWSLRALESQGVPTRKLAVVPLAIDQTMPGNPVRTSAREPLRVLWLGTVILRKGIQYLIESARLMRGTGVEFVVAGPIGISAEALQQFPDNIRLIGRVTRDRIQSLYRWAHVFVLPTISDGFAITQLEAMANGLPVVTTPNCGEVVSDSVDGFIVPARDSASLAEALMRFQRDRDLVAAMSENALRKVREFRVPLNGERIVKAAAHFLSLRDASAEGVTVGQTRFPKQPTECTGMYLA